jgi:uncharacterized protein (DUF4415 family)
MSKKHISASIPDKYDEYPEITPENLKNAKYRVGLKEVSKEEWRATLPRKQRINIMLDAGVVSWFKEMAGERGYQTLINETLKQSISQQSFETTLRKVIREELKKAA